MDKNCATSGSRPKKAISLARIALVLAAVAGALSVYYLAIYEPQQRVRSDALEMLSILMRLPAPSDGSYVAKAKEIAKAIQPVADRLKANSATPEQTRKSIDAVIEALRSLSADSGCPGKLRIRIVDDLCTRLRQHLSNLATGEGPLI